MSTHSTIFLFCFGLIVLWYVDAQIKLALDTQHRYTKVLLDELTRIKKHLGIKDDE